MKIEQNEKRKRKREKRKKGRADLVDGAQVHLSLSHDAGIASAMVIVERT